MYIKEKRNRLCARKRRVRVKIKGTNKIPRLSVYRSLQHIYAQLINDKNGKVLLSASDRDVPKTKRARAIKKQDKTVRQKEAIAFAVGEMIAHRAKQKKIAKIVFDRGGRVYHGRVKALAEGARKGGLKF